MGSCHSSIEHFDIEGPCVEVEKITCKKVSDITEDEKLQMSEFVKTFQPIHNQLKQNVGTAREVIGKENEVNFNAFAESIAGFRKLLRMTKKSIQEQEERCKEFRQRALECKKKNELEKCKEYLLLEKQSRKNIDNFIKRVDTLNNRINDCVETDMCSTFVDTLESVAEALRSMNENIKELKPEEVTERLSALDEYLKELDESIEYPEDDYVIDELMDELDGLIDEEEETMGTANALESLPSAPTHEVVIEHNKEGSEQKEKIAVCEE